MPRLRTQILVHRIPIETPIRTSFGTMYDRPSVLIRVEDENGCSGWGEIWCNFPSVGAEHRARLLHSIVLPLAGELGLFDEPQRLWSALTERLRILAIQTGEPGPFAQCLAGLECALHDLAARRAGEPLWRFLSPDASPVVRVYASGINPAGAPQTALAAARQGFAGCKIKVGFDQAGDRENLLQARALLGAGFPLMADANQGWSLEQALAFAPVCEEAGLQWLEEPLRHDAPDDEWRQLAARMKVPLAAGENFASLADFQDLPGRRRLKVLQPDLGKWGGVGGSLAVARRAAAQGLTFCPHWLGGGVGLLTSLHVKAAAGSRDGYVEVDFNPNPIRQHVVGAIFDHLEGGQVQLPETAGIGDVEDHIADFAAYCTWSEELTLD